MRKPRKMPHERFDFSDKAITLLMAFVFFGIMVAVVFGLTGWTL